MVTRRTPDDSTVAGKGWLDDRPSELNFTMQDQGVVLAAYGTLSDQALKDRPRDACERRSGRVL